MIYHMTNFERHLQKWPFSPAKWEKRQNFDLKHSIRIKLIFLSPVDQELSNDVYIDGFSQ